MDSGGTGSGASGSNERLGYFHCGEHSHHASAECLFKDSSQIPSRGDLLSFKNTCPTLEALTNGEHMKKYKPARVLTHLVRMCTPEAVAVNRRDFCKLGVMLLAPTSRSTGRSRPGIAVAHPMEYKGALRNPLKGLRSGGVEEVANLPYASLAKHYIKWRDIENDGADGVGRIKAFCDQHWRSLHFSNTKVIPRVYLEWPNRGRYWPADIRPGDYSSPEFKRRLVRMIERLGETWDSDPRVAYVETGLIGLWGEQHDPTPTPEIQKLMGDAYTASFLNKRLMNRYPWQFVDYNFGIYWDSFGHPDDSPRTIALLKSPRLLDRWKVAVMGGETAFNWGTPLGKDPTDAVVNHSEEIIDLIRRLHWNHLGWLSEYDLHNREAVENGARIQEALGYRFVIVEVHYPVSIPSGASFDISFHVRNTGSSPFYYSWPIEFSLLDRVSREPVWKTLFQGVDIRKWLPNGQTYEVANTLACPAGLPTGTYTAALAILDPAGNVPGVRFAISNYYNGGRHPIGLIGVGGHYGGLPAHDFDDPAKDGSLGYVVS